jgi:hypothetical protein
LIEHPRLAGWSLAAPDPAHVELSADADGSFLTLRWRSPDSNLWSLSVELLFLAGTETPE